MIIQRISAVLMYHRMICETVQFWSYTPPPLPAKTDRYAPDAILKLHVAYDFFVVGFFV